jgi:hypothetical protein
MTVGGLYSFPAHQEKTKTGSVTKGLMTVTPEGAVLS